ncbi:Crp/Fnr family transcriptional regulator [Parvularcula sp. LCG005]|uniref:Crp/Fnr family transcriptional regulator n=1 Tax=Parvularcula sp. LCG005 TaxID=3078805 RepID=UPI0029432FF9|nr:Crp/Fnr family transcriptional regulator [Parvularcula sp. LCG005]WOI54175.1 Crp/Fnr family transcriptional regulator [Parvularcula sp. LCG005]
MSQQPKCSSASSHSHFCDICDVRERSICAELNEAEMQQVAQTMAHRSIKEGASLIREGELSDYLYLVISGCFRLVRMTEDGQRQIVGFVYPGDFLGMSYAAANDFSAEALEPSLACRFSHGFLDEMSARHPNIKNRLIAKGHTELHKAQDHIVILGKQNAEERVMTFFTMLADRGDANEIYLPMSRQDIADYLGLRLETLSRTLAKLKKAGRLSAVEGRLVTLNRPAA